MLIISKLLCYLLTELCMYINITIGTVPHILFTQILGKYDTGELVNSIRPIWHQPMLIFECWHVFMTIRQSWQSLASSATENRLQALRDHLQVLPSDCSCERRACQSQPPPVVVARGDLHVLAIKTVTFGPRSFASSAPKLWNSLPLPLRDSTLTLRQFSSRLKTHLFSLAYGCASWLLRL